MYKDTVFIFYFNTNQHTINPKQQKELETFLQKANRIKTIQGFTDTTGTTKHNEILSVSRALEIFNNLPTSLQTGVEVVGNGETQTGKENWQNRRVEVIAELKTNKVIESAAATKHTTDSVTELTIEQLLFIPDQPELTESSRQYIPTLAQQLLQYKGAQFEIIGHVNYQSKLPPERLTDLYQLSELRAKAVYELLQQYGIESTRMRYKGVGNSQPVIANPANDAEKRKNMRVQVRITYQ